MDREIQALIVAWHEYLDHPDFDHYDRLYDRMADLDEAWTARMIAHEDKPKRQMEWA